MGLAGVKNVSLKWKYKKITCFVSVSEIYSPYIWLNVVLSPISTQRKTHSQNFDFSKKSNLKSISWLSVPSVETDGKEWEDK